jgi:tetratricopeptide (TPR) repeat protein
VVRPNLALFLLIFIAISISGVSQEPARIQAQDLLRQASKLVPEIPEAQQISVASEIANAQARARDFAGALSTVHLLKKPEAQAQALGSVAYYIDYSGSLDRALELMESAAKGQNRDVAYQDIAWAHARKGDCTKALRIAHLIKNDQSRLIEALSGVAAEQWKAGEHAGAEQTWSEAHEAAEHRSENGPGMEFLLLGIAGSRIQAGDNAGALKLLSEVRLSVERHHPTDEGTLSILANSLAQAGQLTEALDIIKELPPGSNRDGSLMTISNQFSKRDDVADAKEVASQISGPELKAIALQEIATAEKQAGRVGSAIDTIESISTSGGRAGAFASLALEQAQQGDDAARETLRRAVIAASESFPKPPDHVLATIAVTEAMLGDFYTAEQTVWRLPPDARWWAWENLTGMLTESGDLGAALKLAADEKNAHPRAYALLGAANVLLDQLRRKTEKNPQGSKP